MPNLEPPLPTSAELDILAAVWRLEPCTVREVHEAVTSGGKESGYTTTQKQMQLMMDKGLLARSERFRTHVYEARVPKEQTQSQIAADLLRRAFDGSAKSLVLGALSAEAASKEDLREIRKLIEDLEKRRKAR